MPCNLREGSVSSYDTVGAKRVWIVGTKADDGKRFCTLQIVARAANGPPDKPRHGQPKIGIIFRGTGQRISQEEKQAWHKDVHVRFQRKAWADSEYCELHAANEMREATEEARAQGQESVAIYDNLHGQTTDEHLKILHRHAKCERHLLPTGVTSEIQLIDDGIGYAVKNEMGHALDEWLGEGDNLAKWTSQEGTQFSMSDKRIMVTKLAAEAWERVCQRFDFEKAAARIGLRMTVDGTGDELIKLQGIENYTFSDADGGERPRSYDNQDGSDPIEQERLNAEVDPQAAEDEEAEYVEGEEERFYDSSDEDSSDEEQNAHSTTIPEAPVQPPSGYRYILDVPKLDTDADKQGLVGKMVLHAWDRPGLRGWFVGKISHVGVSPRDLKATPTANFVVTYKKQVTKNKLLDGRVASSLLASNYGRAEWWILLEPTSGDTN